MTIDIIYYYIYMYRYNVWSIVGPEEGLEWLKRRDEGVLFA